jgi:hypothetical protein
VNARGWSDAQQNIGDAHTPGVLAGGFGHAFSWSMAFAAATVPLCLLLPSPGLTAPAGDRTKESGENTGSPVR